MHHAGLLAGQAVSEQPVEAGEPVGMDGSLVACEMRSGMFALAIHTELIPGTGRSLAAPRPFIADIAPHPRRLGFAGLDPGLHLDRSIIGEERGTRPHLLANVIGQRFKEGCRSPDPIGQRRPVQIDFLTGVNLGLTVKRQMIAILADQHMRQQPRTGAPALDRAARQRRLCKSLAAVAGHARANDFADDEPPRNVFQLLSYILAKAPQGAAAVGAGLPRRENLGLPLQVVGQRGTAVLAFAGFAVIDLTGFLLLGRRGRGDLGLLVKVECQLIQALRLGAEPRLAMTCQLMFELFDL